MPKRFTATEIWEEDWFLEMPLEYKLFWYYVLSECDHAGVFKVNLRSFCGLNEVKIEAEKALKYFNNGKLRIREINNAAWLIEDFFVFQYGTTLNLNNPMHRGVEKIYNKYNLKMTSIRGLLDHKDGVKVKDKEKDNSKEVGIAPEMFKIFKNHNPKYPEDKKRDLQSCLQIAYKIGESKGWEQNEVIASKKKDVLTSWEKIVVFTAADKWFSKRALYDLVNEWQRLIQSMNGQFNGDFKTEQPKIKLK